MQLAIVKAQTGNCSHQSIAIKFKINRTTLRARLFEKPSFTDKATSQHLLQPFEKQAILNFIDKATQLDFPARLHMVQEKATILLTLRSEDQPSIGANWA